MLVRRCAKPDKNGMTIHDDFLAICWFVLAILLPFYGLMDIV